jgi:hypothetical protein
MANEQALGDLMRLISASRSITLWGMSVLFGCTAIHQATATSGLPVEVPVQISAIGPLRPIDLAAPVCSYISAELRFPRSAFTDVKARDALIGKGTPITMRISISRVQHDASGGERLVAYESWVATKDEIQGWANDYVFRIFGGTTVPSGAYRVNVELLDAHPVLESTKPTFAIVSNFKNPPDRSRC